MKMQNISFFQFINFILCLHYGNGLRVRRIVGGAPAQLPPPDDPRVFLRFAGKTASVKGVLDFPHYVFRGIRYAHNPSGRDRFQRPRQYFLEGDVSASVYPSPCLQPIPGDRKIVGSEDCLFLNVFTPDLPDGTEGLPVIVWIHGGGFRYGSASQYGVRNLVGKRLVLVTIQYRLGTLGFLSTGTPELPGNAGLWDMALAVQWVRNYIGFFGGNPHKIVIMGQGTGASSALMVALSNIAKGSISAVVAMSGTAVSHWAVENNPAATAKEIADYHGCPSTTVLTMLKCLQNLPADNLVEGDSQLEQTRLQTRGFITGLNGVLNSSPNPEGRYDGRSLPPAIETAPLEDMMNGNIPDIPVLTGVTKDETKNAVLGQYKNEIIESFKSIPNFLNNVLIKNLQAFTGLGNISNSTGSVTINSLFSVLEPLQFQNYIKITKNNIAEGLNRISEITADALFNLPAFLTTELWTKRGREAYLYRFEHFGKGRKARYFLNGTSIIGNQSVDVNNTIVGHGDDLAYIFEARKLDGSSLDTPEALTDEDKEVRESFTQIIADFARHGKIKIANKQIESFSNKKNNFIIIRSPPQVENNFKFCEMGLWAGLAERLQSQTCQFLTTLGNTAKKAENLFFDTINPHSWGNYSTNNNENFNIFHYGSGNDNSKKGVTATKNNLIPPMGFLG